jgi:hypothetical protein
MPFYQSDDYQPSVRIDDDIRLLRKGFDELEKKFNALHQSMGYLLLSVGEIMAWWEDEKNSKD